MEVRANSRFAERAIGHTQPESGSDASLRGHRYCTRKRSRELFTARSALPLPEPLIVGVLVCLTPPVAHTTNITTTARAAHTIRDGDHAIVTAP